MNVCTYVYICIWQWSVIVCSALSVFHSWVGQPLSPPLEVVIIMWSSCFWQAGSTTINVKDRIPSIPLEANRLNDMTYVHTYWGWFLSLWEGSFYRLIHRQVTITTTWMLIAQLHPCKCMYVVVVERWRIIKYVCMAIRRWMADRKRFLYRCFSDLE